MKILELFKIYSKYVRNNIVRSSKLTYVNRTFLIVFDWLLPPAFVNASPVIDCLIPKTLNCTFDMKYSLYY